MNFDKARLNMIEQQIRTWDVLDSRVLELLASVHREDFMPAAYRRVALADFNIPIGHGEVTMTPSLEGRLLQSLALNPADRVLEVGTGSGYLTALLAHSAREVVSVDIHPDFTDRARTILGQQNIRNVNLQAGDAVNGWGTGAPYDAIAVTGSVPVLTDAFQTQLTIGGRLFIIVGEPPVMEALLITRLDEREWNSEGLFETDMPPLVGASKTETFTL